MPEHNLPIPVKPLRAFRLLRHHSLTPCSIAYLTREARDTAAQRWADHDGHPVLTQLWDASHPHDTINRGWAVDGVIAPQQATVTLADRPSG